jgi:arylsulfatase A-like enzyme
MRVPCIARWPGRIPPGRTSTELTTMMDLLPTFTKLAGGTLPKNRVIDGKNIWPILAGQAGAKSPHEAFFCYHMEQLQAVRSGPWKLYLPLKNKLINLRGGTAPSPALLYDVLADPGEKDNLAEKHADVVERLQRYAETARKDLGDLNRAGEGQRPVGRVGTPRPLVLQKQ